MKILITTPYYLPNISGITIYINILAEELVKNGHSVTILTNKHDLQTASIETIHGVKIKRVWAPIKIGKGLIAPFLIFEAIKEIQKVDVINCHLPQPEAVTYAIIGKILGKKVILTHHTDLSFWKGIKNKIIDSGVFVFQSIAALLADNIISYTRDYAEHSYFLKIFLKKVKSIYPPIKFDINSEQKNKKNNKYIIGFCGRIAKQKGLDVLIKSCQYLDKSLGKENYEIWLAGPKTVIGENYIEEFTQKYKKRITSNFKFLGKIERKNLPNFYKTINLLVLPSNDTLESFGWVQIEAMLCGTPCVATNLPGMRIPVIKTGMGELFEKNNAKDLADKIFLVVKSGKNKYVLNNKNSIFDYKKSIQDYIEIFS